MRDASAPIPCPSNGAPKRVVVIGTSVAAQAALEVLARHGGQVDARSLIAAGEHLGAHHDPSAHRSPRVIAVDTAQSRLTLDDGSAMSWDRLIVAPARAATMRAAGVDAVDSVEEARAALATRRRPRAVFVLGGGVGAWEVAAAVRARGHAVTLITGGVDTLSAELGPEAARQVREEHRAHGVSVLDDPRALGGRGEERGPPGAVVLDLRERPVELGFLRETALVRGGCVDVDDAMRTAVEGVYAAGAAARWRDPLSGRALQLGYDVAQMRQGEIAASSALGGAARLDALPFRRTRHFELTITVLGVPSADDSLETTRDERGATTTTWRGREKVTAVVTVTRTQRLRARSA